MRFHHKILSAFVGLIISLLLLLYPFSRKVVDNLIADILHKRATSYVQELESAPDQASLIRRLRDLKHKIYFRTALINSKREIIYDTHIKKLLGSEFSPISTSDDYNSLDITQALEKGSGVNWGFSSLFGQSFYFYSQSFVSHGQTYILRLAVPDSYVRSIQQEFQRGFLIISATILALFALSTLFIISYFTLPIRKLIDTILPYQRGETNQLPQLTLHGSDEFQNLSSTLNQLSERVQSQMSSLRQARNEREMILSSMVEGVIAISPDQEVIYANKIAETLLGVPREQLIGQSINNLKQEACRSLIKQCIKTKAVQTTEFTIGKRTRKQYLHAIAAPTGPTHGALLIIQDRTQEFRNREIRKNFIANASHELKTPITIIRGFAETLHDTPDLPKETLKDVTSRILTHCHRMTALIYDLLSLTDLENKPSSRKVECKLHDLIEASWERIQEAYPEAKMEISEPAGRNSTLCQADPSLLTLALTNLLENAAKYSPDIQHVTVTLSQSADQVHIAIQDRGQGIPEEELDHIFQRFYTVQHERRKRGSGLGLSIVETIIEKHGGQIEVESTLGESTTFTVSLPKGNI